MTRSFANAMFGLGAASWIIILGVSAASATTYLVRPDGTGDYPTIRAAIEGAAPGDTISLVDGIFLGPDNRDLDFAGKPLVIASESGVAESCIVDCESAGRGFLFQSGEDSTSVLKQITIRRGNEYSGSGIQCLAGSSPRISECVLSDHLGLDVQRGPAIDCKMGSSPIIEGCVFERNIGRLGGTVYCESGSSPRLVDCLFLDNVVRRGAGIYCDSSHPIVRDCMFISNGWGLSGGVFYLTGASSLEITGSTIAENIVDNSIIYLDGGSSLAAESCTIVLNDIEDGAIVERVGAGGTTTFSHTILANSVRGRAFDCTSPGIDLDCCDVYGNPGGDFTDCVEDQLGIDGNISAAPLLCDAPNRDYTLAENSPCTPENLECGLIGAWPVGCPTGTRLELTPPLLVTYYPCGGTFSTDLWIEDVVDLGAFELCIGYDGGSTGFVSAEIDTDFLESTGRTATPMVPSACSPTCRFTGTQIGASTTGAQPGPSGAGHLATLVWERTGDVAAERSLCLDSWTFENTEIPPEPIVVSHTLDTELVHRSFCYGDFNDNGDVSIVDVMQVALRWGSEAGGPLYNDLYDVDPVEPGNYCISLPNGSIDVVDVQSVAGRWGYPCGEAPPLALNDEAGDEMDAAPEEPQTWLAIAPAELRVEGQEGELASFSVEVREVQDLGAFETTLLFDPIVIQIEDVILGSFLGDTGRMVNPLSPRIDNENGSLTFGAWTAGDAAGSGGSGRLAEITLRVAACPGRSGLEIADATLTDRSGWPMPISGTSSGSVVTECPDPSGSPMPGLPDQFVLLPSRPNPFDQSTVIGFAIPSSAAEDAAVELRLLDASGRCIRRLASGVQEPGHHEIVWDGRDDRGALVPNGTYFCRATWGETVLHQRMQVLR